MTPRSARRLLFSLPLVLPYLPLGVLHAQGDPCVVGYWEDPFQHGGFNPADPSDPWVGPPGNETAYMPLPFLLPSPTPTIFEAIHMALIPKGENQGKVLAVDWSLDIVNQTSTPGTVDGEYKQRFSVIDPGDGLSQAPSFMNGLIDLTAEPPGDLMCGGHSWTDNGDLFWAGGNEYDPTVFVKGHKKTWVYTPQPTGAGPGLGTWTRNADMLDARWYPTVTTLGFGAMLITGGTASGGGAVVNSYQVAIPFLNAMTPAYAGPVAPASAFNGYPRIHLIPQGLGNGGSFLFHAGDPSKSSLMDLLSGPNYWHPGNWGSSPIDDREHGTSVLQSNFLSQIPFSENAVWRIGGAVHDPSGTPSACLDSNHNTTASVETTNAGDLFGAWANGPSLNQARMNMNVVLLPDGTLFVVGGTKNVPNEAPVVGCPDADPALEAELLAPGASTWTLTDPMASSRIYHSTALLLPDGRVLTAGGDPWLYDPAMPASYVGRTWDYQIYVPPYLACGNPRPRITQSPGTMNFASTQTVDHNALGVGNVAQVVLMSPGSVTHAFDQNQRRVELEITGSTSTSVTFQAPDLMGTSTGAKAHAPAGYYMLFLVSDAGTPSVARWVKLQ